jgi:GNAT superfamily N-acetyltransferase
VLIREVIESDLAALLELYDHFDRPDGSSSEGIASAWQEMLAHPGLFVYAGEVAPQLVTSCTLVVVPNLRRGPKPYGLIELVVTHSGYRRRGYGTAVVKHALAAAWEKDCYKVMLLTGRTEEGILRFYEGAGFARGLKTGFVAAAPPGTPSRSPFRG